MSEMARLLAYLGGFFLLVAGLLWLLDRLGLGGIGIPGTITVRSGGFTLFAPVGLWILISLGLTILLNVIARLTR